MIKMIFCDMDGTLLDAQSRVPDGFDAMMKMLKAHGVRFAPASGRQYFSLLDSFPAYAQEFIFLAENGTNVMYQGRNLYKCPLDKAASLAILKSVHAADPGVFCVFCGLKDAYVLEEQYIPVNIAELQKYYTHAETVRSFDDIPDDCIKVSLYDAGARASTRILPHLTRWQDAYQVVPSSDYWIDVMDRSINKGVAVRQIQKQFGLKAEECAAFGDYLNDLEMLQSVGYSFAMANAHPKIKEVCRYETASNEEAGVLRGIQRLLDAGLC